jgi:hypothetical protein
MGTTSIDRNARVLQYFMIRNLKTGAFAAGTGLRTSPKLYSRGCAHQVASFWNNNLKRRGKPPEWDVVGVTLRFD